MGPTAQQSAGNQDEQPRGDRSPETQPILRSAGPSDRRGTDAGIAGKENIMTAKITYLLTEQAQRDAMGATGQPVARQQTIEAEIPTTDLDLFAIGGDGTPSLDMTVNSHRHLNVLREGWCASPYQWGSLQTYESLVGALRAAYATRAAAKEAAAAAEQAKIQAEVKYDYTLADNLDALQATGKNDWVRRTPDTHTDPVHPRSLSIPSHMPLARTALAAYYDRWDEQRTAEAAAATAAEEVKEQAKLAAIATWVRDYGTLLQQARHADGLLPRAEATRLMADWVMASYSVPPEDDRQVCTERECPCSELEVTSLSESAYEVWADVRAKLPGNHTVTFWCVKECPPADEYGNRDESTTGTHTAAYITIPYGPFQFTRQIFLANGVL